MPRDSRRASEGLVGRGAFAGVEYAGKWRDLPESAGVLAGIEHAGCNVRDRQFQDSVLLADERGRVGVHVEVDGFARMRRRGPRSHPLDPSLTAPVRPPTMLGCGLRVTASAPETEWTQRIVCLDRSRSTSSALRSARDAS